MKPPNRSFTGTTETGPQGSEEKFVGRECEDSPGVHGAATLLRAAARSFPPSLEITWAVFLPVAEPEPTRIPICGSDDFRLLLHGCFILDSGRRQIQGFDSGKKSPDSDESDPDKKHRCDWNAKLRDSVTLPLVPGLLLDAFKEGLAKSDELAAVTAAVAKNKWFGENRCAICREGTLARVLEAPSAVPKPGSDDRTRGRGDADRPGSAETTPPQAHQSAGRVTWRIVPNGTKLRPLPKSVSDHPERMDELFEKVHLLAKEREFKLYVDPDAALTAGEECWTAEELDLLFGSLAGRVFSSCDLAELLADFLETKGVLKEKKGVLEKKGGSHVVRALCVALQDAARLAPRHEHVKRIIKHVPSELIFPLPLPACSPVLQALAEVAAGRNSGVLPVSDTWISDDGKQPEFSLFPDDVAKYLQALEPLIKKGAAAAADTEHAGHAAEAALALFRSVDKNMRKPVEAIKVFRGSELHTKKVLALSFQDLCELSKKKLLLPRNHHALFDLLADAVPDVGLVTIDEAAEKYLKENTELLPAKGENLESVVLDVVVEASSGNAARFDNADAANVSARAKLLKKLDLDKCDNQDALRILCAGDYAARGTGVKLYILDDPGIVKERAEIFEVSKKLRDEKSDEPRFLVPEGIVRVLSKELREHLAINDLKNLDDLGLDDDFFERLADRNPSLFSGEYRIFRRVKKILLGDRPHLRRKEILDALCNLKEVPEGLRECLRECLRERPWLDEDVSPKEVLNLPESVVKEANALKITPETTGKRWVAAECLPDEVKKHSCVKEHLLPDEEESLNTLVDWTREAKLVVLLGTMRWDDEELWKDLKTLASHAELKTPGWPLLSAMARDMPSPKAEDLLFDLEDLLFDLEDLPQGDSDFHTKFDEHLNALAKLARDGEPEERVAARRVYNHEFKAIAESMEERNVFEKTRVPTAAGDWRLGREVVGGERPRAQAEPNGIEPTHVLCHELAQKLSKSLLSELCLADRPSDDDELNLKEFLEPWKGHVPAELVIVCLGLVHRGLVDHDQKPMQEVPKECAKDWENEAAPRVDRERWWGKLDKVLHPKPKDGPCFRIRILETDDKCVLATSLSGDQFNAPLVDVTSTSGLIVHMQPLKTTGHRKFKEIYLRQQKPGKLSVPDTCKMFRQLAETIAHDCLYVSNIEALGEILCEAASVDQATLMETESNLRDRLPLILEAMKLPEDSVCLKALLDYHEKEKCLEPEDGTEERRRDRAQKRDKFKWELWGSIKRKPEGTELSTEEDLLDAIRRHLDDYSADRVLFELFQNADDAYAQIDEDGPRRFRVEEHEGFSGIRVTHWGRRINYLGKDHDEGHGVRGRDLLNMLVMGLSGKSADKNVTGKFGVGFKCVHLLSDHVGIASGFIALKTRGGFLPEEWPEGIDDARKHKEGDHLATVIDLPFAEDRICKGKKSRDAFRSAAPWLLAFARRIRRIEIGGDEAFDCEIEDLSDAIKVVKVVEAGGERTPRRALQFDLELDDDKYSLLLAVGPDGPLALEEGLKCIWNLAPLKDERGSGWLLNGPFPVLRGRGRLKGGESDEPRRNRFRKLGKAFGQRLLTLHDLIMKEWVRFAEGVGMDAEKFSAEQFGNNFCEVLCHVLKPDDCNYDLKEFLNACACESQKVKIGQDLRNRLAIPEEEAKRREVGEEGEKHANKHLCEKFGSGNVKWVSRIGGKQHKGGEPKGVDDCGYDFECIDAEGEKHYFEVKATSGDKPNFHLGISQIRAAHKYGSQWHILGVLRVWDSPKFNCLPNPLEDDSKVRFWPPSVRFRLRGVK